MKEKIKNILKKYPTLFKLVKNIYLGICDICFYVNTGIYRIFHFKEVIKADVVLSMGNHCQAAHYMQVYRLRKFASPIDWMKHYSLDSLMNLFKYDFKDFFINNYQDEIKAEDNGSCLWVVDSVSGMIARHHFLKDSPLNKQIYEFRNNQIKRYKKIKQYLEKSNNIVFISCRQDSLEDLKNFLLEFQKLYNKNLTIVNFRDSKTQKYKKVTKIGKNLKIIEYVFDNTYPLNQNDTLSWIGNFKEWGGV